MREKSKGSAYWREQFKRWQSSGLTKQAFSRKHDFSKDCVYYWFRKFEQAQESQCSIVPAPFTISENDIRPFGAVTIRVKDKFAVEIRQNFQAEVLRKIMGVLEEL